MTPVFLVEARGGSYELPGVALQLRATRFAGRRSRPANAGGVRRTPSTSRRERAGGERSGRARSTGTEFPPARRARSARRRGVQGAAVPLPRAEPAPRRVNFRARARKFTRRVGRAAKAARPTQVADFVRHRPRARVRLRRARREVDRHFVPACLKLAAAGNINQPLYGIRGKAHIGRFFRYFCGVSP